MLKYVYRPVLCRIDYCRLDTTENICDGCSLHGLISVCDTTGLQRSVHGREVGTDSESQFKLETTPSSFQGFSEQPLQKFMIKAKHIYEELGPWAADYFILESIARLRKAVEVEHGFSFGRDDTERAMILEKLSPIATARVKARVAATESPKMSHKLDQLISFLVKEDEAEFSGLVFVRQRATVFVMAELLSKHPKTRNRFHCAAYVGMSNNGSRTRTIGELLDTQAQRGTLSDFREGRKNLIIATDVLEEGIDITACRLVICYDHPPNLKSFVQRRGRARQKKSKFAILVANDDTSLTFHDWQKLEEEMVRAYQDDNRRLQEVSDLESTSEVVPDKFLVESTG